MSYTSTSRDRLGGYALGIGYIILAVTLVTMLFKIWPPVPWPTEDDLDRGAIGKAISECNEAASTNSQNSTSPQASSSGTPTTFSATPSQSPVGTTQGAIPNSSPAETTAAQAAPSVRSPVSEPTFAQSDRVSASQVRNQDNANSASVVIPMRIFGYCVETTFDERLLLLVIVAGMLGSFVHAATSLADYIGNDRFHRNWTWFYLLRPVIGMALALVFYFVIRGGFLTTSSGAKDINPYGIAALAGLVGMFSKQATDKLGEVFSTLFRSVEGEGDDQRSIPLRPRLTAITIANVEPNEVTAGATNQLIIVTGSNFDKEAKVSLDDELQETTFEAADRLVAQVSDELLAAPGILKLKVVNPDNLESPTIDFKVVGSLEPGPSTTNSGY